ncbi:hypothetical protein CEQ21_03675 [Niallia circulans]|uniref:Uncharacterized protein n=1 Tax=Niallia circulans TaxID=1397 RepID=A0A553SSU2_NIACI|nr:hypothetical protein [Niallia circulans]TRZ40052.1 hypothetical protein CEQ21_03675 [Niallia circulans]
MYWFKKGDIAKLENVRKFISNGGLYSNKVGLKSALFDWRPLPRRNERDNQFPYKNINVKEYLQAFQFKGQSDNQYNGWVLKQIDLFKNILSKFKIPILLSFGDVQSKLILFQNIWPEIKFKRLVLEASNKTIYVSKEKVGSNTTVIVAEFLDYQNLGYTGTKELVKYLKEHIIESLDVIVPFQQVACNLLVLLFFSI